MTNKNNHFSMECENCKKICGWMNDVVYGGILCNYCFEKGKSLEDY